MLLLRCPEPTQVEIIMNALGAGVVKMAKLYTSRAWLWRKFVVEKLSAADIAKLCGVSEPTIYNWLNKFGLIK